MYVIRRFNVVAVKFYRHHRHPFSTAHIHTHTHTVRKKQFIGKNIKKKCL